MYVELVYRFDMTANQLNRRKPRKERKDNADMRRRQILDATFKSIVSNGLAKTTLATVANEAGLSQGVAIFYFKSKTGILSAALQDQYGKYETHWQAALARADSDPASRMRALIEADFDPDICNPQSLAVWFAFFGEQGFVPQYAEITASYESKRAETLTGICLQLAPDEPAKAALAGEWIDTLTDGYWQKLHLFPQRYTRANALARTLDVLATLFPAYADAFSSR